MQRGRLWVTWTGLGGSATAAYFLLPSGSLAANLAYNAIGLISGLMLLIAVRLHRPERPARWYWFAAGQITSVLGDVVFEIYKYVLHREWYPSPADALYLGAYPMLVIGLLLLVRDRGRGDLAGLIDASIVATGLGLVFWLFVMRPIAAGPTASSLERIISTAYPAADALLLAIVARLYTSPGKRTTSSRLLGVAALLMLIADVGFSLVTLYSGDYSRLLDAGWLLSYVLWASAALHPSMRSTATDPCVARSVGVGRGRLALLTGCSLLAPAMLLLPSVAGSGANRTAIGVGSVLLFLLVVLRMSGFVAQVQHQSVELGELAMLDDLTGLANRRSFEQRLSAALSAGPAAVALLDLNGFKEINDELGHVIGDRLLIGVARRLVLTTGGNAVVARMGGDEYAILIAGDADSAEQLGLRLQVALAEPIRASGHELLVSAGIGLASGDGFDAIEVLRRADVAMSAAKRDGDCCRWFTAELDRLAGDEARIGAELRTALDTGQFHLVYQPIVELSHGHTVAVEALVRWEHPERGLVNPGEFITVAERNGLIVELGTWVLRTACQQAVQWQAEYGGDAPRRISVNVSARQLARPDFVAVVEAALADSGLAAGCLAIEVTETAVFEGGRALTALHGVHELGVWIALDDFGTGHSSLTLLQTVPVDLLKIDKSFVDSITMAGRHAVIATALIQISDGLGLSAVAEGVETEQQAIELARLGYRFAQGFHFGRPVAQPNFPSAKPASLIPASPAGFAGYP